VTYNDGNNASCDGTWTRNGQVNYNLTFVGATFNYTGNINWSSKTASGTWMGNPFNYRLEILESVEVKEVKMDLTADELKNSWGTYSEDWNGLSLDKDTKYHFEITFGDGNRTAAVKYNSQGKTKTDNLELNFEYDKGTVEGVKKTIWLHNGSGYYAKEERGKKTRKQFRDQDFTIFLLGPRLVFGIDMPPILLHELRLQKRILANLSQPEE